LRGKRAAGDIEPSSFTERNVWRTFVFAHCACEPGWLLWARDDTPIPLLLSAARVHA
jgi:hypothetical protein